MFSHKHFFSLVIAVLITVFVVQAAAQSNEDYIDYGETGEELVITAGRTSEPAKTIPSQITIITSDDIAKSGASSVAGLLETVPGVRFSGGIAGAGSEAISMRGFGENSYGRVLILVDGNKINNPDMSIANWNAIPLGNIERIEVLDGSASVQYGNNAVGGVVNIITKKGGAKQTSLGITGGSFFNNRESLFHFEPFPGGNYYLSMEHSGSNGYRDRQSSETVNLSLGSGLFVGDSMQLSFNGFFSYLYFQLPGSLSKEQFEDDPKQALYPDWNSPPYPAYFKNKDDENTEYHFGGGLSFRWFPAENIEFMLPLSYRGKSVTSNMASSGNFYEITVHSTEARPQGSVIFNINDTELRLLGGVDFYYTYLYSEADGAFPDSNTVSERTIGPYLTARFSPLPGFFISAGSRFDLAVFKAENRGSSVDDSKTFTAFVYDAGIVYNPLENLKLYARYAALFRYPFIEELVQYSTLWGPGQFNSGLKPEKGFNAEAGAVWQHKDRIRINADFFFMQMEDEINWNGTANENMDKTRRFGTNAGINLFPSDFISIDISYSWVHAFFAGGANKDKQVPLVPRHKIYGNLMIHLPFGLSFGPDFEYTSSRYEGGDSSNTKDPVEACFLLGARLRFVFADSAGQPEPAGESPGSSPRDKGKNHLALQITGKNLLNKNYASYVYYGAYYPADGLSINVSLQYRF